MIFRKNLIALGVAMSCAGLAASTLAQTTTPKAPTEQRISVEQFAKLLASSDELIRAQRLEEDIALQALRGAEAIYEPFAFVTVEREGLSILASALERSQFGVDIPGRDTYTSLENRVKTGLALKAPTGADVEISYNVSQLKTSTQQNLYPAGLGPPDGEFKGYLGLKLTQPLLRNAGVEATESGIRVAETEQVVAKETLRQVKAQRLIEGLQAFITVQRAEGRLQLRQKAFEAAEKIEAEIRLQNSSGLRSDAELAEAQASLALRRSQLAQGRQEFEEQQTALQIFVSARERVQDSPLQGSVIRPAGTLATPAGAAGKPASNPDALFEQLNQAVSLRPEARVNQVRIERESIKLDAAKLQTLPELNFTLRAGVESLSQGYRPFNEYWGDVPYDSWLVGLTFKIGLFGDKKRDSEYQTAVYRRQQAQLSLDAVRQRIANEFNSSESIFDQAMQQVNRQQEIVNAQRKLLEIQRQMLDLGRVSRLDYLKKELELFTAEEALVDAQAFANRASYLVSQVEGKLLARLGLE